MEETRKRQDRLEKRMVGLMEVQQMKSAPYQEER